MGLEKICAHVNWTGTSLLYCFFICNITETNAFMLGDKIAQSPLFIFHFALCINSGVNYLVYIWYFQQPISKNIPGTALLQKEKR